MLNKPKANMSLNHSYIASKDTDPIETKGWLLSICSVIKTKGLLRSKYLAF
ncbi:hypothetical protein [Candidatus Tremblaya phenacola]|uniref:hypothetical protein n=1 Tax=Candidatus Tremblayella phenacoccinincola TaxID=1010676 RepID=UPI001CF68452|nr:hypothetical protein [Candidatus Tremblaya phenacola]KAH0998232.1 hypothetical protein FKM95_000126 [Candidatus Tremblaya phenacola]